MRFNYFSKLKFIIFALILTLSAFLGVYFSLQFLHATTNASSEEDKPIANPVVSTVLSENILTDGGFEQSVISSENQPSLSQSWRISGATDTEYKLNYFDPALSSPDDSQEQFVHTGNVAFQLSTSKDTKISHANLNFTEETIYRVGLFVKPTGVSSSDDYINFTLTPLVGSTKYKRFAISSLIEDEWNELGFYYRSVSGGVCSFSITLSNSYKLYLDDVFVQEQQTNTNSQIKLYDGAAIRLDTSNSGLRFTAQVGYDYFNSLKDASAGIIILPTSSLKDGVVELALHKLDNTLHGDVKYLMVNVLDFENNPTAKRDGSYVFSGTMDNILPQNVDRKFSARAFVKYTNADGLPEYVYSDFDLENNSRSVHDVALYWAKPEYSQEFTPEQFKILSNYAQSKQEISSAGCVINGEAVSYIFENVNKGVLKIDQLLDVCENIIVIVDGQNINKNSQNWYTLDNDSEQLIITLKGVSFDASFPKTATIALYTDYLGRN